MTSIDENGRPAPDAHDPGDGSGMADAVDGSDHQAVPADVDAPYVGEASGFGDGAPAETVGDDASVTPDRITPDPSVTRVDPQPVTTEPAPPAAPEVRAEPVPPAEPELRAAPAEPVPPAVPAAPVPPVSPTTIEAPARRGRIRRFFRTLFRVVLVLAVLGAIGAAAAFAWPEFDERVLQRVDATASDTAQLEDDLADATARIDELEQRADAVESDVEGQIDALSAQIDEGLTAQDDEITSQRLLFQSMDLLSRARLYLYQANYGFAEADIATAAAVLAQMDDEDGTIAQAITRLDAAAVALPDLPVVANDEVNLAWALLLGDTAEAAQPAPADATPPAAEAPATEAPAETPAPDPATPAG